MSAGEACAVAASVIRKMRPTWEVEMCPISDGSDGFASILTQTRGGELIYNNVMGPNFKQVEAHFGLADCEKFSLSSKAWLKLPDKGKVAIVEMAQASGLSRLVPEERNLWFTSSYGTGELLKLAIETHPELIVLGLGGSATHDLGMGALEALGLRFRADNGEYITHVTPNQWGRIVAIEGELPQKLPRIILAPNVQNKLLGPRGAGALFGAQKGLKPADKQKLEEQTLRMAELLLGHFDAPRSIVEAPGSGAAGGIAVGLLAALKVEIMPGVELCDRWLRLNEKMEKNNIIITGESKLDLSSLEGKAPLYVIEKASNRGKRIFCMIGNISLPPGEEIPMSMKEAKIIKIFPEELANEKIAGKGINYLSEAVRQLLESFPTPPSASGLLV